MPHEFNDLKGVGDPLKKLIDNPDSDFKDLFAIEDLMTPLKELTKGDSP